MASLDRCPCPSAIAITHPATDSDTGGLHAGIMCLGCSAPDPRPGARSQPASMQCRVHSPVAGSKSQRATAHPESKALVEIGRANRFTCAPDAEGGAETAASLRRLGLVVRAYTGGQRRRGARRSCAQRGLRATRALVLSCTRDPLRLRARSGCRWVHCIKMCTGFGRCGTRTRHQGTRRRRKRFLSLAKES